MVIIFHYVTVLEILKILQTPNISTVVQMNTIVLFNQLHEL